MTLNIFLQLVNKKLVLIIYKLNFKKEREIEILKVISHLLPTNYFF